MGTEHGRECEDVDRKGFSGCVFPWLCNNNNARFQYTYTDGRGWPTYQYLNSQHQVMYLHFYDEGLFYDGFYVINDLETGYEEVDGRVFIYNSDSDDCPDDTGRNCTTGRVLSGITV